MLFISTLFSEPEKFIIYSIVVIFSICCHEYAHARIALWQGDPTARDAGHLTLNPLKQMGFFSVIMLLIIGLAWGAVPVDPHRMRHRYSAAITALAGPAMNLLLFIAFSFLLALSGKWELPPNAYILFGSGAVINFVLCVLNLLPVPPLDGWGVLNSFFPKLARPESELAKGATLLLIVAAISGIRYLFLFGEFMTGLLTKNFMLILGF